MVKDFELVRISQVGEDYALHFSNGKYAVFDRAHIRQVLKGLGAAMEIEPVEGTFSVN